LLIPPSDGVDVIGASLINVAWAVVVFVAVAVSDVGESTSPTFLSTPFSPFNFPAKVISIVGDWGVFGESEDIKMF